MTAALSIVSDGTSTSLSPARRALAEHLATVAEAADRAARARSLCARVQDQFNAASAELQVVAEKISAFDDDRAGAIVHAAQQGTTAPTGKPSAREKLGHADEIARDNKTAVEAALRLCEAQASDASAALRVARGGTDQCVQAVLTEEHDAALARLEAAIAEREAAAAEVDAIHAATAERGAVERQKNPEAGHSWFVTADRMASSRDRLHVPSADRRLAIVRWKNMLARLAHDPEARG